MLLLGERVSAGALPLWLAALALELVAVAGTAALFLAARGPGRALLTRAGPRLGLTGPRLARAAQLLERRGWPALVAGRTTPGLRTVTVVAAASSGVRAGRALPALVLGSSLFLQAHLLLRRRRPRVTRVLAEGACPACLALGLVGASTTPGRTEPTRSRAGSPGGGA
jgi:membrane protein DedA with SNARE-associated domain